MNDEWRSFKKEAQNDKELEEMTLARVDAELQIATKRKSSFINIFTKVSFYVKSSTLFYSEVVGLLLFYYPNKFYKTNNNTHFVVEFSYCT